MMLSDVCLSRTWYNIGNNSRTERLCRKTKIGTQVADVTHDSDTIFKVKRSKVHLQGRGNGTPGQWRCLEIFFFQRETGLFVTFYFWGTQQKFFGHPTYLTENSRDDLATCPTCCMLSARGGGKIWSSITDMHAKTLSCLLYTQRPIAFIYPVRQKSAPVLFSQ